MRLILLLTIGLSMAGIGSLCRAEESDLVKNRQKQMIQRFYISNAKILISELSAINEVFSLNGSELDLNTFRSALENVSIEIIEKELIDNTGSLVDVIGKKNSLKLNFERWNKMIRMGVDLRPLILHELFRISAINDDDYVLSAPLYGKLRVVIEEEVVYAPYCNLRVSKTKTEVKRKRFSGVGFEPIELTGNTFSIVSGMGGPDISYDNAKKDVLEQAEKQGYYGFQYISGQTITQRRNINGFRKMEKKTSIKAYSFKDKIKKRRSKDIKKETCRKIFQCLSIYKIAPKGQVSEKEMVGLLKKKKESKCK